MTKFSPGPWFCGAHVIADGDGQAILTTHKAMTVANARLIAAAPDMYAALKNIIDWNDAFRRTLPAAWLGDPINDACEAAKLILSKAEGK